MSDQPPAGPPPPMYAPPPAASSKRTAWLIVILICGGGMILVCCFVGMLAAIAVPNFLEAQVRSKVSRTRSDLRSMAVAIEAYRIDHGAYPASTTAVGQSVMAGLAPPDPNFSSFHAAPHTLTTPVAYLTGYFPEPFAQVRGMTFFYTTDGDWFLMWSPGPDKVYDISPTIQPFTMDAIPFQMLDWTYDPTNGTVSSGDIWRVSY